MFVFVGVCVSRDYEKFLFGFVRYTREYMKDTRTTFAVELSGSI
jgi:hypothetical protein